MGIQYAGSVVIEGLRSHPPEEEFPMR